MDVKRLMEYTKSLRIDENKIVNVQMSLYNLERLCNVITKYDAAQDDKLTVQNLMNECSRTSNLYIEKCKEVDNLQVEIYLLKGLLGEAIYQLDHSVIFNEEQEPMPLEFTEVNGVCTANLIKELPTGE